MGHEMPERRGLCRYVVTKSFRFAAFFQNQTYRPRNCMHQVILTVIILGGLGFTVEVTSSHLCIQPAYLTLKLSLEGFLRSSISLSIFLFSCRRWYTGFKLHSYQTGQSSVSHRSV